MGSKEEEEEEEEEDDTNQTRNATEHKFHLFSRTRIQKKKLVACSSYELQRKNKNCIYCRNMKGMGTEKGRW